MRRFFVPVLTVGRVLVMIVAVIAVLVGPYFGRIRGLRQLGNPTSECAFIMPGESAAVAQVTCPPGGKSGKNQEEEA